MGNRAVITTKENVKTNGIGVYLHWNGGRDSVEGFLEYCRLMRFREPDRDCYGWARFCQVVGNYFGGDGLSVGIDCVNNLDMDNGDNGTYLIKGWKIAGRMYAPKIEQKSYGLTEMLLSIDETQPSGMRLGEDFILAKIVKRDELEPGSIVYIPDILAGYKKAIVLGKGRDFHVSGRDVRGIPFTNTYTTDRVDYSGNINNYLFDEEYRVARLS